VDANLNRAREGLRAAEDFLRFSMDMPAAYRRLRRIRHGIEVGTKALGVAEAELVHARDSVTDPGRAASSFGARSVEHLVLINLQRAKEALRVLEESGRLLAPRRAALFQRLRFQLYDAERAILLRLEALRHPRPKSRRRP